MTTPYSSMPNTFRRDLRAGKSLIGCWASLASNITTEILGYAGFDWLLLDGEHAPNDYASFITQLQALKDSPSAPFVRPQWQDPVVIKRLLDIGFYNFLIPFIESAEQAQRAVAATRYPPDGFRGVGTAHRSNQYGFNTDYFKHINDNICVTVQIESPAGVLDARACAAATNVIALLVGGEDLATALGGQATPEVLRVPKLLVHYAARAEGRLSFGLLRSVADYADLDGIRAAAEEAHAHGFDGATCVHPSAVPILNLGCRVSPSTLTSIQIPSSGAASTAATRSTTPANSATKTPSTTTRLSLTLATALPSTAASKTENSAATVPSTLAPSLCKCPDNTMTSGTAATAKAATTMGNMP